MKYNLRKYTINFKKKLAKDTNKLADWKTKFKYFKKHYENYVDNIDYEVYNEKAKGIKFRSKCNWYEHGEKFTKFS